jgi:hypothetical protein
MRRVSAFIGMVLLVAVIVMLVWRVYAHHRSGSDGDVTNSVIAKTAETELLSC